MSKISEELIAEVKRQYLDFRGGRVAATFLDVANTLASHRTGALKAGIQAFSGSPPEAFDTPEEAPARDTRAGTPAPAAVKAAALKLSREAGLKKTYGFASAASYSSYQAEGTSTITARPYWQAALAAAGTVTAGPSAPSGGGRQRDSRGRFI
jgi:hypothetical protein